MKIRELFTGRVVTLSNFLSLSRILLVPCVWHTLDLEAGTGMPRYRYYSIILLIILMSTDFFDGFLARTMDQVSRLGQFIDPLADKISAFSMGFLLYHYKNFPIWIILVMAARDIFIVTGGIILFSKRDIQVRPNMFGKIMVASMPLAAFIYILSPQIVFCGLTLQQISISLLIFFLIISTLLSWKIYSKVYFETKK